ncbi:MAG: hypothetical protein WC179_03000 [Candidatus Cloacimonadaceae bacterium]|nr:hypothetical protein [Candidatus Cloacimonadota bacterium]MCB5258606.1 hypothetical protein [Candidatus Cloacimonadota bacterium]MDY0112548.1 hypothetical protein [Candidatus Syntrophosphaera sp.]
MENRLSVLGEQHLGLRLLIIVLALVSAIIASWQKILLLIGIFLSFMLLDCSLYKQVLKGLRVSLPFFAVYWILGTIFQVQFPALAIFNLKVIFFILAGVYALGNITPERVINDTRYIRKFKWGRWLVHFGLATSLYIQAYTSYFTNHKPEGKNTIGEIFDSFLEAGSNVLKKSQEIEDKLEVSIGLNNAHFSFSIANLVALLLAGIIILIMIW